MRIITINPPTLFDITPYGFNHIRVDTSTEIAHIGGQVGINQANDIVGSSLSEQLEVVEVNLKKALKAVEGKIEDIIEMTTYIVNMDEEEDTPVYVPFRKKFGSPPGVLLSVAGLALKKLRVETEMKVAVSKTFVQKLKNESGKRS